MSQLLGTASIDPAPGVGYERALAQQPPQPARGALGVLMGLSLYYLLVPLTIQLILLIGWTIGGRSGGFGDYYRSSVAFERPLGLLAGHLGLALLIPISLVLVRFGFGVRTRWVASVQPGLRWRYLLVCFVVAAVVLNALVLAFQRMDPTQRVSTQGLWLWVLVIVISSPLQAAAEEYFFRGLLVQAVGSMTTLRWVSVVASGLVFALMHGAQNLPLFVDRFGFGLMAGALVLVTGGLEAGIACHVANNLFAFGWALFYGGVAQLRTTQAVGWTQCAMDLGGFALFGLIAWWVGRRMGLAVRTPGAPVSAG